MWRIAFSLYLLFRSYLLIFFSCTNYTRLNMLTNAHTHTLNKCCLRLSTKDLWKNYGRLNKIHRFIHFQSNVIETTYKSQKRQPVESNGAKKNYYYLNPQAFTISETKCRKFLTDVFFIHLSDWQVDFVVLTIGR